MIKTSKAHYMSELLAGRKHLMVQSTLLSPCPKSCDKTPREIVLCLLKTAFVPRKCHLIKQEDTDQSHLTLWKASQVKLTPGAPPQAVCSWGADLPGWAKKLQTGNQEDCCQLPVSVSRDPRMRRDTCEPCCYEYLTLQFTDKSRCWHLRLTVIHPFQWNNSLYSYTVTK